MPYVVDDAIAQVLSRLAEAEGSQVAELPADGGPAISPEISTAEQILIFLNEGQERLTELGVIQTFGKGTKSDVAGGTVKVLFTGLSMSVANQRMFTVRQGSWSQGDPVVSTPVQYCDRKWYEVHHPMILVEDKAIPERVYQEADGVLLGPRPLTPGTLVLEGVVFPRPGIAGGSFADLPVEIAPRLIAYACAMLTKQNGAETALAAVLPIWEAEWRGAPVPRRTRRDA